MRNRLLTILTFILLYLINQFPLYSQSDRWKYVYTGNNLEYYYDNESISYKGTKLTFWCKWVFLYDNGYNEREIQTLFEYDCYYRTYKFLYQISYKNDGSKSEEYLSILNLKKVIIPGDQFEPVFNVLCK